ncbi:hypothetical protein EUA06_02560 [Nocardioides glacieisoli]|uniref:Uncharacterized protein n=1 Tax=Nocardioides glacieisoli TaxID=1168730 RepID=A0A4Q2S402_9ACTN|nr:hypothetical protein [Nocardioides glacieisoli]MDI4643266.1 hypothetical protein [Rhodoblastus acidophilus]RYB96471.1 hypothetical protein EUA06_02560 [Nocardioides glacieisoli]
MDLMDRFEKATSGGPEHRAIEDRLAVGRRASARRRASLAAGATAAVLTAAGVVWAVQPGVDSVSGKDIVASDAGSVERDSGAPESPTSTPSPPTALFRYDLDTAALEVADGVTIVRQVENPVPHKDVTSAAAVVDYRGERRWVMAAVVRGRSGWGSDIEATSSRNFGQWVHELTVLNTAQMFSDGSSDGDWVTLDSDGGLTAQNGATVVEQSTPARIDQAPADVPSAVGTIDVDGALLCVVARMLPGEDVDITYLAESEHQGCGEAVPGIDYPGAPATS